MTAPTPEEIAAILRRNDAILAHDLHLPQLARCPDCRRVGQLLAVGVAVGFMAGVALCVVAVYWVMTLD